MRRLAVVTPAFLLAAACGPRDTAARDTAMPAAAAAGASASADPTRTAAGGTGAGGTGASGTSVPAGYEARTDQPGADLASARYDVQSDGSWEVRTGPAHVVWAVRDSASGTYEARGAFMQLEAPAHPEAFGLVVGGRDLRGDAPRYTYFVVRGTGEYLVRVREGATTRDVRPWTAAPSAPKPDASGRATYDLAVRVAPDSVRFLVNGAVVTTAPAAGLPLDGVAGVRINHNLHVRVRPVTITR